MYRFPSKCQPQFAIIRQPNPQRLIYNNLSYFTPCLLKQNKTTKNHSSCILDAAITRPSLLLPPRRRGLFSRRPAHAHNHHHHHTTTTTTTRPKRGNIFSRRRHVVHHQRKPSIGDKISGALLKLRGTLTNRPGVKVRCLPVRVARLSH